MSVAVLDNLRIVLVNTSHQGNIGSAARAMKTMGLSELVLVDPVEAPQSHASALAAGATDILAQARTVPTLQEAIADCHLVLATSARSRTLDWPMLNPREAGKQAVQEAARGKVALVFGRENSGLTNEELQLSQYHVHIPANPDYSSLNLAMAVQTLSYEVRMAWLASENEQQGVQQEPSAYPRGDDLERFYQHLEQSLTQSGFIVRQHPGLVMNKLRRLFNRARPDENELNILRGILSTYDKRMLSDKTKG
ncbi:tRNA (cytosine(32)/uridine(32)-2'-O)-methyltransferase TrmJ [Aliidiomarina sedimenti]|uniref:tRNA (cytidine/uridine-2'-O-)-methyltransferase TrmJ n=1 Tax=Aliidiomarina sedimenti TaxID=1933879 RepID=A0ABY0BZ71_9GAMM|nr:tRNA (cytosine(32)/uridine(32)-2'-O)-methyltransferase TrmJ [Aliidiomarina sedimenti]RUO29831.1 tRNA (cytosine(32)/uridine(32)-2'-O)-methyltransferase TrmJ [Aliidiomarina sedimenti]